MLQVRGELPAHGIGFDPDLDVDAGGPQPGDALAGDRGVGIFDANHDAGDTGRDQRIGARRRAAVVRARLERGEDRWRPLAAGPAACSATASACGPPGGSVAPS